MAEEKKDKANHGGQLDTATNPSKDFFISYNRADKTWAVWIAWQLEEVGFKTILQAWDFRPGANFVLKMQEASKEAERTIAVLSPNYLKAEFTQPEWAAAFSRDPLGKNGLLVPVMVHDCRQELEGLWPQIVYIDLVGVSEKAASDALFAGINRGRSKPNTPPAFPGAIQRNETEEPLFPGKAENASSPNSSGVKPILPKLKLDKAFNPYKTRDEWIEYVTSVLQETIEEEPSLIFHAEDVDGHRQIRILRNQDTIFSLNIKKGGFDSDDKGISFAYAQGRTISSGSINAWGHFKWNVVKESVVLELHDMSLLSSFASGDVKIYTKEEFLQALWDRIRSVIERSTR